MRSARQAGKWSSAQYSTSWLRTNTYTHTHAHAHPHAHTHTLSLCLSHTHAHTFILLTQHYRSVFPRNSYRQTACVQWFVTSDQ